MLTEPDVGSDPARLNMTATPLADGSEYVLYGVKLWTTNSVVADLLVVMARVRPGDGHRGGITAFVVEADAAGITVQRRNAFMGLRGLENGVTRFHEVRVPAASRVGGEGQGLKIALTTLNTGRLAVPASCAAAGKLALKIAREWSRERVQWGRPVGEHEAVAKKVSFIAATTYAMEAALELSSQLADDHRSDIRIEAALAKLYCSVASKIADELLRIRGGRGYETAASSPRAASVACPPNNCCGICASTGSSRVPRRSCGCSSRARPWTRTCPWPASSSIPSCRQPAAPVRLPRRAGWTPGGCPRS